uniref:HP domain-containing protein n=1 Tax=Setaria digitata TaxID=48799 RepID=A0A915Q252_9BILA
MQEVQFVLYYVLKKQFETFVDGGVAQSAELPKKGENTILELQKHALKGSAERWRERIKRDPDLQYLDGVKRLQKDFPAKRVSPKVEEVDICKGLDRFYSSVMSPPSKVLQIDLNEFQGVVTTTPRLVLPLRTATPGRRQRNVLCQSSEPLTSPRAALLTSDDHRRKTDNGEDVKEGISNSARKGLQSKVNYSAVKLKKREIKSPYPELMLIRLKGYLLSSSVYDSGDKNIDVRLVAPKYTSVHGFAVFILVTPKQLFLYQGKYANLLEKSKAAVITARICEKNGELRCNTKHFENVHEGMGVDEFWRLLGWNQAEPEQCAPDDLLVLNEPFENVAAQVNAIYEVDEQCTIRQNLIFDFGSEIYIWVGRNSNRAGTQRAVAYGEILRDRPLNVVAGLDRMVLGDDFDVTRPVWCLIIKLTQGLDDWLFQHKFHDWDAVAPHTYNMPLHLKTLPPNSSQRDEENARNLGRNLASRVVEEPALVLEETELYRNSKNVFTENVRYFVLKGEKTLSEVNELWIFRDDRCYIVKWEYRIERVGIRKLDGTEREKETGRQRAVYFYWLGRRTTRTEQGLCALALRDFDTAYFPHERIAQVSLMTCRKQSDSGLKLSSECFQGQEPPLFLQLFQGSLIIRGYGSGIFLVYGSSVASEARMEEQPTHVIYRHHAVYITLNNGKITVLEGRGSNESSKIAAVHFAEKIKTNYTSFEQFIAEPCIEHHCLTSTENCPVIEADRWIKPPRLFRLFERDAEELSSTDCDPLLPFSFRQDSFRDTIMVDQENRLWLWSDKAVSTFALRVADAYWSGRSGPKTVVYKTKEPNSFKALFAKWDDFVDETDENELIEQNSLQREPVDLDELLRSRTKTWPLEKVTGRDLPPGVDLDRLEQYLNDDDFHSVFQMERTAFYALPHWKQVVLRKKHKLF